MHRSQKTKLRFLYGALSKRCHGSSKDPEEKANVGHLFAADYLYDIFSLEGQRITIVDDKRFILFISHTTW